MARKQAQGGNRGQKGSTEKPKGKVGSESGAAKAVGGKGDFGVSEKDTTGRAYTSANTRASDPGAAQPRSGEDENRTAGAGGHASGAGSSSGGDVDTDVIGVGAGGTGIAQTGPDTAPGPDDSDGSVREFASGPPTKNKKGADAVSQPSGGDPERLDDSFLGEISGGEAAGEDNG
jgi:hypothetical protein